MTHQQILGSIARRICSEKGQDLAEYGLLVGFIAIIVVVGASLLGDNLLAFFQFLAASFPW